MEEKPTNKLFHSVVFYWLPVFVWALVIFQFSSRPVAGASEVIWQDFIIKKTAHLVEYGIFAILTYRALKHAGVNKKEAIVSSFLIVSLYGVSDEFHQSFTPGREPRVRDMIIDSTGSFLALYYIYRLLPNSYGALKKLAIKLGLL